MSKVSNWGYSTFYPLLTSFCRDFSIGKAVLYHLCSQRQSEDSSDMSRCAAYFSCGTLVAIDALELLRRV